MPGNTPPALDKPPFMGYIIVVRGKPNNAGEHFKNEGSPSQFKIMTNDTLLKVTIDESGKDLRTEFVRAASFGHARRITWNSLLTSKEREAKPTIKVERAGHNF
jgi:hypothetical protein